MTQRIEHAYTHRVVCPHCGHLFDGSWEWEDNGDVRDCSECDGRFKWERVVEVSYNSSKAKMTP